MAFVRKRVTRAGAVTTTLMETYREGGTVKQRTIANMHGAETVEGALREIERETAWWEDHLSSAKERMEEWAKVSLKTTATKQRIAFKSMLSVGYRDPLVQVRDAAQSIRRSELKLAELRQDAATLHQHVVTHKYV